MTSVLLFANDGKLQQVLASALGEDYSLKTETDRDRLVATATEQSADVVLLDIDPERFSMKEYVSLIAPITSARAAIVVMTDDAGRSIGVELMHAGAHFCCRKPPAMRELKAILTRAHEYFKIRTDAPSRLPASIPPTVFGCDSLIGTSASMRLVYDLIHKVATLDASVLVTGESGTGKELIARAIHNTGNRANRPFVAVSCGAIPESLIEAELFGHEKGAFTGAMGQREGYFEKAADGTLFLDEIGELNPQIQVKLLRVLQQREFHRLGSSRSIPLRARLVLATHRDLTQMIAAGEFRQDLFYRINIMNIKGPPLRGHSEDIPLLVNHFIRKYSESYHKPIESIDSDALSALQSYNWPGNIRELENVIQRSVIMADGYAIGINDLPDMFESSEPSVFDEDHLPAGTFDRMLRDYKIKLVTEAIQQCNGNKKMAAESLSISIAYLYRLISFAETGSTEGKVSEISAPRRNIAAAAV